MPDESSFIFFKQTRKSIKNNKEVKESAEKKDSYSQTHKNGRIFKFKIKILAQNIGFKEICN